MDSAQLRDDKLSRQITSVIGSMLAKQKTLKKVAKKRNLTLIEKKLNEELATLKLEGAQKIQEKMLEVN